MNAFVRRHVAVLLEQVKIILEFLDAEVAMQPEPDLVCQKCEGPLRQALVDGKPGLICGECNVPVPGEGG